jgi:hypothetical protein
MADQHAELDSILALQISVAWAGEARSDPSRLGWWQTDLVDAEGGGDLLLRLLPQTHAWAKLEAVREAARRVDEQARRRSGDPDRLVTLFHLGVDLDERLRERLAQHKRQGTSSDALGARYVERAVFDPAAFEAFLRDLATAPFESAPEGRLLTGSPPAGDLERAEHLAAALLPLSLSYPMPHYRRDR